MAVGQPAPVVVIGGGIAGLTAAYRLSRAAPGVQLTLIEQEPRLGGKIVTERTRGFVIEGGPDCFLAYKPAGVALCRELGLGDRLIGTSERGKRAYVMCGGRLYALPDGFTGLVPSRLLPMAATPLLSPFGKLRAGIEYFIPPRREACDESLAGFVTRRLGRETYDRILEPLLGGICAGDGEQLSLEAIFPQLSRMEREHGGLFRAMRQMRREARRTSTRGEGAPAEKKGSPFLTTPTGLAELVEALERGLQGARLLAGRRAVRVSAKDSGYSIDLVRGERLQAQAVVLATPAYATADLIESLVPDMAATLREIPYASTATVSVVYPLDYVPRALDGSGYVVPRAEGRPLLGCTWTSTKFPHRAPEGFALIRAFLGRAGDDSIVERTDEDLLRLVRDELRSVLGICKEPKLTRIYRWPKGMPQYTLGHLDRVERIERLVGRRPGLFVAGSALRGVGIPDCIESGEQAAAGVLRFMSAAGSAGSAQPLAAER